MSTLMGQAVTAITEALQRAPAVCAQVGRVSLRPIAQAAQKAVVVRPLQSESGGASQYTGQPITWTTSIAVECYARSTGSASPDEAVDTLLESVYARLMADITLSGAVLDLDPQQVVYDFDADGDKTACATVVFKTLQRATAGTLS